MRTTIDLPDDLLLEAKRLALERRSTLREITAEGLRLVLKNQPTAIAKRMLEAPIQLPPEVQLRAYSNDELARLTESEIIQDLNAAYR